MYTPLEVKKWIAMPLLALLLSACGFEDQDVDGSIEGYANPYAAITAKELNGITVGNAVADADGRYSIEIKRLKPQVVRLIASGGEYYEPGDEFPIRLGENSFSHAVLNYINGQVNAVRIDFASTLAAGLAEYRISSGMKPDKAVVTSHDAISRFLGVDFSDAGRLPAIDSGSQVRVFPAEDVSEIENAREISPRLSAVITTEALSELADQINIDAGLTGDSAIQSHILLEDYYSDVSYDGLLNGVAAGRTVSHGGVVIDESYYRHEFALSIIRLMQSPHNQTQITASAISDFVVEVNEFNPELFGDSPAVLIPEDRPYVEFSGFVESEPASGIKTVNFRAIDFSGVAALAIHVDDQIIDVPVDSVSFDVDTSFYKNEIYTVKLVATSNTGAVSEISQEILFSNEIDETYVLMPDDQLVSGQIELSVKLGQLFGIAKVEFFVDGEKVHETTTIEKNVTASVDSSTLQSGDGDHTFRVNIVTNSGNVTYKTTNFRSDNTGAVITWPLLDDTLLSTIHQFSATVEEDQVLKQVKMLYDGNLLRKFDDAEGEQTYDVDLALDTRTIFEGEHIMSIEAQSMSGVLSSEQRRVYVDWNDPTVNIITPSGVSLLKGETLDVQFQALDTNGIQALEYFLDGTSEGSLPAGTETLQLSNPLGLVKDSVLRIEAEDLAGRKSADSILVSYRVLNVGTPSILFPDSNRATITFVVEGVGSELFEGVFVLTDPGQNANYADDVYIESKTYNPATGAGSITISFPGKRYTGGCGINWKLMRYSFYVKYRGQTSNVVTGVSDVGGQKAYIETPTDGCSGGVGAGPQE